MTETDLMNLIRLKLTELGYIVFRANVGTVRLPDGRYFKTGLPAGFSDLFAVKNGRVCFIEVKVEPNKPTAEQIVFINQMRLKGCVAGVAYSVEEAVELARSYGNGKEN